MAQTVRVEVDEKTYLALTGEEGNDQNEAQSMVTTMVEDAMQDKRYTTEWIRTTYMDDNDNELFDID